MRLLLDTHALLWWLANDRTLAEEARQAIRRGADRVFVSAASVWEIAIKRATGKLNVPSNLTAGLADSGFEALPITIDHAITAGALPLHHRDPFDRMLVAQALAEQMTIMTRDRRIPAYGVPVLLA